MQIDYDPELIVYEELLRIFWASHSPEYKMPNKQYMSIIFYHNEEQKIIAYDSKNKEQNKNNIEIYTEIQSVDKFYLAEAYHQKYYLQLTRELMNEFSRIYPKFKDTINSTAAAHVNGYIKGFGTMKGLLEELEELGLSEEGNKRLVQIVEGYGR